MDDDDDDDDGMEQDVKNETQDVKLDAGCQE